MDKYFEAKGASRPLRCLITAEAGGGKTLGALVPMLDLMLADTLPLRVRRPGETSAVVVVPTPEVADQWIRAVQKLGKKVLPVLTIDKRTRRGEGDPGSRKDVVVVTKGQLRTYVQSLGRGAVQWDTCVLDEAENLVAVRPRPTRTCVPQACSHFVWCPPGGMQDANFVDAMQLLAGRSNPNLCHLYMSATYNDQGEGLLGAFAGVPLNTFERVAGGCAHEARARATSLEQ